MSELFSVSQVGQQIYTRLGALEAAVPNKLPLAGGILTGGLTGTTAAFTGLLTAGSMQIAGAPVATQSYVTSAISGLAALSGATFTGNISAVGITTSGTITSGGTITQGGAPVATQAYVTAQLSSKASLSGASFTGNVTVGDTSFGLNGTDINNPVVLFDAGDSFGYARGTNLYGFNIGSTTVCTVTASTLMHVGNITSGDTNFGLFYNTGSTPFIAWDSGDSISYTRSANTFNFNVGGTPKMSLDGNGVVAATQFQMDANYYSYVSSGTPIINFDTGGDYLAYDRGNNLYAFYIGSNQRAALNASGFSVAGVVYPGGDANFFIGMASGNPRITLDSGDYIEYDRASNQFNFVIGSTRVASLNSAGNLRTLGTITQSVTP